MNLTASTQVKFMKKVAVHVLYCDDLSIQDQSAMHVWCSRSACEVYILGLYVTQFVVALGQVENLKMPPARQTTGSPLAL